MSKPASLSVEIKDFGIQDFFFDLEDQNAVGDESFAIAQELSHILTEYLNPISRSQVDPATKFCELKRTWEEDTIFSSSINEIAMHPAYQQIIGMGPVAIPYIMRELQQKPGHWFWALNAITGENPIPFEKRGKLKDMTEAWLIWWGGKKYQWER